MAEIQFKGKTVHTHGEIPKEGTKAPGFTLVDQDLNTKSLHDYDHRKKVIYTIPSVNTAVCAKSTKKYSDLAKEKPDAIFFVVSADLPFAQKNFCSQETIANLVMLSTFRDNTFGKNYGVLIIDGIIEGLLARSQIVLDSNNQVIFSEIVGEICDEPNFEKALSLL